MKEKGRADFISSINEKVAALKNKEKTAEVKTPLLPHQERVINKIKNQRGLVVAHNVGKGKSLSAIAAQDSLGAPATYIMPAALKGNMEKEIKKHTTNTQPYKFEGMENLARKKKLQDPGGLTIVDEAHRARNPQAELTKTLKKSKLNKLLLLTGTPFVNSPSDISPLVNMASGEELLPENKSEFESKYIFEKQVKPSLLNRIRGIKPGMVPVINKKNKGELQNILQKWVDYEPGSKEGFPDVEEQEFKVPMSDHQLAVYDTMMDQAPAWVAAKIKAGLPPSKQESAHLNAYLQAARQAVNTTAPFIQEGDPEAPKIQTAFQELKKVLDQDPTHKGVIVSNYLNAGLNPYAELLKKENIPYGMFTGGMKPKDRDQMIRDYNEGKLRALLLSPAGSEGIDLKGSTVLQQLDPNWNEAKSQQAQARAIRYLSHAHLPEEKRKVILQKFLATRPRQGLLEKMKLKDPGGAVDEYLYNLSKQKDELNQQFIDLLKSPEQLQQKVAAIKADVEKYLNNREDYKFLLSRLKSKTFVNQVIKKTDDEKLKNFIKNNALHLNKKIAPISISSFSKPTTYEVKKHNGKYTCSCPNYMYAQAPINGECKHIKKVKEEKLEKTAAAYVDPYQQETQTTCSAACLKMVLKKYGRDFSEKN